MVYNLSLNDLTENIEQVIEKNIHQNASKSNFFNETRTSDAKEISNKNVNFCNNNRWGLYYYAGLWPAFLCFSLVQIFLCSYCCLFITSFSCDIEQVFDKKLREGVSYVSLDDANKTHSLFFFSFFSAHHLGLHGQRSRTMHCQGKIRGEDIIIWWWKISWDNVTTKISPNEITNAS